MYTMLRTTLRATARMVALAMALSAPSAVSAQAASTPVFSTKGFSLGVALNGSSVDVDDDEVGSGRESGGGISLLAGYGFTPNFSVFAEGAGASMSSDGDRWILSHFDLGIRYAFTAPSRRFVPYLESAFSAFAGTQDDVAFEDEGEAVTGDLQLSGTGLTLGAGFHWFFNPRVALTTGIKFTTGEFDTVKFDNVSIDGLDIDATSARVNVGVTWYLRGKR